MKFYCNDELFFEINSTKEKVFKYEILEDAFEEDIKRRMRWIIEQKYKECFSLLRREWEPKLKANGVKMIPLDEDEFAELVFSQPNYKSGSQRVAEIKATQPS